MSPDGHSPVVNSAVDLSLDAEAGRVFDAYLADFESGRPPDPEGLIAAHPRLADRLRACLDVLRWTDRLAEATAAEPGLVIGDFRIVREIGRGGMGVVYEAEQLSLGRRVALKVLQASSPIDPKQFHRFQVEAHAAACLHHAHIVPVFTTGSERGVYFYAMQYIDGWSLDAVIRDLRRLESLDDAEAQDPAVGGGPRVEFPRGRGFFETVARLGIQAADALDYAHSLGIVHRDIKPANLIVDHGGDLWVADFGLARVQADSSLTGTGDVLGTARYMSPEQVLDERGIVDHRSDIYSLGATLYELMTLRPAREGRDRAGLIRQIGLEEPKPPRLLNPAVPRDLETVVLKAMARDLPQRYASARDLADDLRRFLDHRPIRARRPGPWKRACKWARRHRPAVISAAGVLLALAASLAVIVTQQRSNRDLRRTERMRRYVEDVRAASHLVQTGRLGEASRLLGRYNPGPGGEDLRSFPWYHLWRICHERPVTLPGHSDSAAKEVYHLEPSPRGDLLASCGQDGAVRFWDAETGRLVRTLRGHDGDVNWVAFSPDGSTLATAGDDGAVRLWPLSGNAEPVTLGKHENWVNCVLFTPDGRRLISGARDGKVKAWDVAQGRLIASVSAPTPVEGMALTPDGRTLATAEADGKIGVWDAGALKRIRDLTGHRASVMGVAFSHDGLRLASACADGTVGLWDPGQGVLLTTGRLPAPEPSVRLQCVAFSLDDLTLASCGDDGTVRLWNPSNGDLLQTYRADGGRLWCVAFSRDGRSMAACGGDGMIRRWDVDRPQDRAVVRLPGIEIRSIAFAEGSSRLLVASTRHHDDKLYLSISCWDVTRPVPVETWRNDLARPDYLCCFSHDGALLCTVDECGRFSLWDTAKRRFVRTAPGPGRPIGGTPETCRFGDNFASYQFSTTGPDGKSQEEFTGFWDLDTDKTETRSGRFRPIGRVPGTGSVLVSDGAGAFVWDPASDRSGRTLLPSGVDMNILTKTSNGCLLAGGWSGDIHLYRAPGLQPAGTIRAHLTKLVDLDFSPDGRVLASLGDDAEVKLWDTVVLQELQTFPTVTGRNQDNRHLRFSHDGDYLVCAVWHPESRTSELIVWPTARIGTASP